MPRVPLVIVALACLPCVAAAAEPPGANKAVAACERAVREALGNARGPAVDVAFNAPPQAVPGPLGATEQVLRGAGRSKTRAFTYNCNVDAQSGEVSGVVVRDAPGAQAANVARAPAEPDLSHVSPTACESAAAAALSRRWPNGSQIQFDPATRALQQDSATAATLRGQGSLRPQVAAPATHFSYRCELDPRNGRVLATRIDN
jgi:hypothetical protein